MRHSPLRRAVFPLLLALLSACWPQPLPHVLKIGLAAPFEGRYRYVGYDAIYAARLAVKEINQAGGVNGWHIELVAYDDRGNAAFARSVARDLLTDPDIVAVVGHFRQESTEAAAPLYIAAGMPLLSVGAWLTPTAGVWQLTPSPARFNEVLHLAGEPEMRGNPYAQAPVDSAEQVRHGQKLPVGGPPLAASDFAAVGGAAISGTLVLTPYPYPADVPGTSAWREAYRAMGLYTPQPGQASLAAYEAIYVLAAAIRATPPHVTPSRDSIAQAMAHVERQGLLGRIRWDARGVWETAPLYLYRWSPEREASRPLLQEKFTATPLRSGAHERTSLLAKPKPHPPLAPAPPG